jgi:tRNA A-37 threonylcarbamoyl transferase component Bud32
MLHEEATIVTTRPIRTNARNGSFFVAHPKHRVWLRSNGITTGDDAMALRGEIIGGHPDRHVARVELSDRTLFVKRELVVGRRTRLKNWWIGAGAVSRSEREAKVLRKLEAAGLPCPQWLAYGEDSTGRAFLITEEFEGASELRSALNQITDRTALAERIGKYLAELHEATFGTPELAAKHLFVNPETFELALLDWQSAVSGSAPTNTERTKWFGNFHATLSNEFVTSRERLRLLWAYRRVVRASRRGREDAVPLPRFSQQVRAILYAAEFVAGRSSVRQQRQNGRNDLQQRLVWLDGEAAVAIPEIARGWPTPASAEPFYRDSADDAPDVASVWVTFAEGQRGIVHRFETSDSVGRAVAALRERPWRSPASRFARLLFLLASHGIPAPRLYAFGQRAKSAVTTESFVAFERIDDALSWQHYFTDAERTNWERRRSLQSCGELMRMLHVAGCRWADSPESLFQVIAGDPSKITIGSPLAVELKRKVSSGERNRDLQRFRNGLSRAETGWFLRGYLGEKWAVRRIRRSFASGVL